MQGYNADVVLDLLEHRLRDGGRGSQTRLAEAVGVRVQTVNKWAKRQTSPEPDKWPAIEAHFGMEPGTIRSAVGWQPEPAPIFEEIRALREQVSELASSVLALTRHVQRLDKSLGGARGDGGAPRPRTPKK